MKDSWNTISLILITLFFPFFLTSNYGDVLAAPTRNLCHPEQRDAILEFKNDDCCSWDRIRCDAKFGNVIELNLSSSCLHGHVNSKSNIFRLQNLCFLDLSNNHFSGQILSSLQNLSNLTTLDLSENHFSGQIPSSLGNLLHTTSLDLTDNNLVGDIPTSLGNLSHLTLLLLGINVCRSDISLLIQSENLYTEEMLARVLQ
ncbi:putative leucine-rich repeat domain superfamily [Arabidopsis thaliana]